MRSKIPSLFFLGFLLSSGAAADYLQRAEVADFIDEVVAEEGLDRARVESLLGEARYQQPIIDAISRPAERVLNWGEYRKIFLTPLRQQQGVEFWAEKSELAAAAEAKFGVPAEVLVAIIGVETSYGRITGRYRVIDALATLAFDYPPRSPFFRSELRQFMLLTKEQPVAADQVLGSYAGAMGMAQFISSSYRNYAVDGDGDGVVDLWASPADALFSIGNYLARHGWVAGQEITRPVQVPASLPAGLVQSELRPYTRVADLRAAGVSGLDGLDGDLAATLMRKETEDGEEYWVGLQNFYAVTRYNHSSLYAMAVVQLAQRLAAEYRPH